MITINQNTNILSEEDWEFLNQKCENFNASQSPVLHGDYLNYFYREFIDLNDKRATNIIKNSESFLRNELDNNSLQLSGMWINRIDINSNKDDDFHHDITAATLVIYLNDDFEGGEFEYVDDNKKNIKLFPKKNLTLAMNNKLYHRVLPVTSGVRYSLISFFNLKDKKIKTLI